MKSSYDRHKERSQKKWFRLNSTLDVISSISTFVVFVWFNICWYETMKDNFWIGMLLIASIFGIVYVWVKERQINDNYEARIQMEDERHIHYLENLLKENNIEFDENGDNSRNQEASK